jgi:hypothetical protein
MHPQAAYPRVDVGHRRTAKTCLGMVVVPAYVKLAQYQGKENLEKRVDLEESLHLRRVRRPNQIKLAEYMSNAESQFCPRETVLNRYVSVGTTMFQCKSKLT